MNHSTSQELQSSMTSYTVQNVTSHFKVHFEVTCVVISYQFGLLTIHLQQSIENHYHSEIFCISLE